MPTFPRAILPIEVTSLELPGPLISKAQSGRVNIRATQQAGRTWTERFLLNTRSVNGRALLAAVDDYWRNGTIFTISHMDHLTPLGAGGGTPLVNQPTQLVSAPEDFTTWTVGGTGVTRTAGQLDPYGGTAAYLLTPTAAYDRIYSAISYTGDGTKSVGAWLRAGSSTLSAIIAEDGTAGLERHRVEVTWTAGVPSLATGGGGGTLFSTESWGNGWYRITPSANSIVAANINRFAIRPDQSGGTATVYAFGANAWNSATPAGYIGPSHPAATGTRLYCDGATASVSNWLRAGDIVSVAGLSSTYHTTTDMSSQTGGYAVIPVSPPIFTGGAPSDNAAVTITGVTLNAVILEPPEYPRTDGTSYDWGTMTVKFSEAL